MTYDHYRAARTFRRVMDQPTESKSPVDHDLQAALITEEFQEFMDSPRPRGEDLTPSRSSQTSHTSATNTPPVVGWIWMRPSTGSTVPTSPSW